MTTYYVSGDWHLKPDEFPKKIEQFILEAKSVGAHIRLPGDIADFIPVGVQHYIGSYAMRRLGELLQDTDYVIIPGNHDPYAHWMEGNNYLMPLWRIWHEDFLEEGGYVFTHGHQRSDWAVLQHVAPQAVQWMVDHYPVEWYWLCRQLGWLPSTQKKRAPSALEEYEKYTLMTLAIHNAWRRYGDQTEKNIVFGHTHKAELSYCLRSTGEKLYLLNWGDMETDSTYLVIKDGVAELRYID